MEQISQILKDISRFGRVYREENLEPLGLSSHHGLYLREIGLTPGISQEQLGKRVVLNKSNIARQLAALEELELVKREVSNHDRRVLQCYPTEKCQQMLPQIRKVYRAWREQLLQDMTAEEQELLEQLLAKIKARAGQWMEDNRL